jgi:hypothetical protein
LLVHVDRKGPDVNPTASGFSGMSYLSFRGSAPYGGRALVDAVRPSLVVRGLVSGRKGPPPALLPVYLRHPTALRTDLALTECGVRVRLHSLDVDGPAEGHHRERFDDRLQCGVDVVGFEFVDR